MKRSPLSRSKPPKKARWRIKSTQRGTVYAYPEGAKLEVNPSTPVKWTSTMIPYKGKLKPKPKKRKPLRKRGQRAEREAEALVAFRKAVLAQARHQCERCGAHEPWVRLHAHHKLPRSRGGLHDPKNGACLCSGPTGTAGCHAAVHDHTAADWSDWIVSSKPRPNSGNTTTPSTT